MYSGGRFQSEQGGSASALGWLFRCDFRKSLLLLARIFASDVVSCSSVKRTLSGLRRRLVSSDLSIVYASMRLPSKYVDLSQYERGLGRSLG